MILSPVIARCNAYARLCRVLLGASLSFYLTPTLAQTDVTDTTDVVIDQTTGGGGRSDRCILTITPPPDKVACAEAPDYNAAHVDPGRARVRGTCPPLSGRGTRSDGKPFRSPFPLGETIITWTARDGKGNTASAQQKITVVRLTLAIDSNNDSTIDEKDAAVEDNPNLPGKILIASNLDRLGTGVPGFASGLNRFGGTPPNVGVGFPPLEVRVSGGVDLAKARLRFRYSAADPARVTRDPSDPRVRRLPIFTPGSGGFVRLWTRDNNSSRRIEPVNRGDFIPPDVWLPASAVLGNARSVRLHVEGVNESKPGEVRIQAELDPDGSGQGCLSNAVRATVTKLVITFTDVTGITSRSSTLRVNRIPPDKEPDGIACDWQAGVPDGGLLLMRVHASPILYEAIRAGRISLAFGHMPENTRRFSPLPANGFEGEYRSLEDQTFAPGGTFQVHQMGVALPGEQDPGTGLMVVDARYYRPPFEFHMAAPLDPHKERKLRLAVRLTTAQGALLAEGTKPHAIALVRPPLVLVHGIASSPAVWYDASKPGSFAMMFDVGPNNFGFHCVNFRVDHSGRDPLRPGEGRTMGMGVTSNRYALVAQMIGRACQAFRDGYYFAGFGSQPRGGQPAGKRIALQKADCVCHSYGGILTRWYVEQAGNPPGSEFESRRNVRKLITLGTPHKGSPLANMVCEVYRSTLIGNASAGLLGPGTRWLTMKDLLDLLESKGLLPNALPPTRTQPRHAYQEFCVNSGRLAQLNARPFHDDVAYAAVIGTSMRLEGLRDPFIAFAPFWSPATRSTYGYFPWIYHFNSDPGATDSIVPRWSAELGVPAFNVYLPITHTEMAHDAALQATVRAWLDGVDPRTGALTTLPLGAAQRAAYRNTPPVSDRNAYEGSRVGPDGVSRGGGLRRRAIVKVELSDTDPYYATFGSHPSEVGPRRVVLTGMMQVRDIGTKAFVIDSHERGWNNTLHNLGVVSRTDLNLDPADLVGAGPNDWVTYQVEIGRIGRTSFRTLTGPSGTSTWVPGANHLVSYAMDAIPDGHSPPAEVTIPKYVLPPPRKGGPGNLTLTLEGAVECTNAGSGSQSVTVHVYSKRPIIDDKLSVLTFAQRHPPGVWNGLLIPYQTTTTLHWNASGRLEGNNDWTRSNPADVYQMLIMGSMPQYRPESTTIKVP